MLAFAPLAVGAPDLGAGSRPDHLDPQVAYVPPLGLDLLPRRRPGPGLLLVLYRGDPPADASAPDVAGGWLRLTLLPASPPKPRTRPRTRPRRLATAACLAPSYCWRVTAIAAAAHDGRTVATVGHTGTLRLWDVTTGDESLSLPGHEAAVSAMATAADGRTLASCGFDGTARLWSVDKRGLVASLRRSPRRRSFARDVARRQDVGHRQSRRSAAVVRRCDGPRAACLFGPSRLGHRHRVLGRRRHGRIRRGRQDGAIVGRGNRPGTRLLSATKGWYEHCPCAGRQRPRLGRRSRFDLLLWDAASGKLIHSMSGDLPPVNSLFISRPTAPGRTVANAHEMDSRRPGRLVGDGGGRAGHGAGRRATSGRRRRHRLRKR